MKQAELKNMHMSIMEAQKEMIKTCRELICIYGKYANDTNKVFILSGLMEIDELEKLTDQLFYDVCYNINFEDQHENREFCLKAKMHTAKTGRMISKTFQLTIPKKDRTVEEMMALLTDLKRIEKYSNKIQEIHQKVANIRKYYENK